MNSDLISVGIAVSGFVAGVGASVWSAINWYANAQKKSYAAERDFNHLRRNQEQMQSCLVKLDERLDQMEMTQRDIQRVFHLVLSKQGGSWSEIFGYSKKDDTEND